MNNGPITTSDKPTADFRVGKVHVSQFRQFSQFGGQHTCTRKKQMEAARVRKQWKGAFKSRPEPTDRSVTLMGQSQRRQTYR